MVVIIAKNIIEGLITVKTAIKLTNIEEAIQPIKVQVLGVFLAHKGRQNL